MAQFYGAAQRWWPLIRGLLYSAVLTQKQWDGATLRIRHQGTRLVHTQSFVLYPHVIHSTGHRKTPLILLTNSWLVIPPILTWIQWPQPQISQKGVPTPEGLCVYDVWWWCVYAELLLITAWKWKNFDRRTHIFKWRCMLTGITKVLGLRSFALVIGDIS